MSTDRRIFSISILISVCAAVCEKAACPALATPSSDEEAQKGSEAASGECLHLGDIKVNPNFTALVFKGNAALFQTKSTRIFLKIPKKKLLTHIVDTHYLSD